MTDSGDAPQHGGVAAFSGGNMGSDQAGWRGSRITYRPKSVSSLLILLRAMSKGSEAGESGGKGGGGGGHACLAGYDVVVSSVALG